MPANIDLKTSQNYEAAGVRFNLSLTSAAGPGEASFSVTVDDLASKWLSKSVNRSVGRVRLTLTFGVDDESIDVSARFRTAISGARFFRIVSVFLVASVVGIFGC